MGAWWYIWVYIGCGTAWDPSPGLTGWPERRGVQFASAPELRRAAPQPGLTPYILPVSAPPLTPFLAPGPQLKLGPSPGRGPQPLTGPDTPVQGVPSP